MPPHSPSARISHFSPRKLQSARRMPFVPFVSFSSYAAPLPPLRSPRPPRCLAYRSRVFSCYRPLHHSLLPLLTSVPLSPTFDIEALNAEPRTLNLPLGLPH